MQSRTTRLLDPVLVGCLAASVLFFSTSGPLAADEIPARALTPPALPTEVSVGLFDVEVFEIDERQETFLIEADLQALWADPRLTFPTPGGPAEDLPLVFEQEAATDFLKTIWWPNFELVDGRGSRNQMHLSIKLFSDGSILYSERFTAEIKQNLDLRPFPFDSHDISFALGPFSANAEAVVFLPLEADRPPVSWEPSEWVISNSELVVFPGYSCSGSGETCSADTDCPADETCAAGWASAQVHMSISRVPKHYVWKIIFPLALIVLVSSAVFWLDLGRFPDPGDRLTISFTGVLTVVAFDFVSSDSLPKLWYTTALDRVLVMAYVFLAINILLNVVATQLCTGRPAASRRTDLLGRWLFPVLFLIGLWIMI